MGPRAGTAVVIAPRSPGSGGAHRCALAPEGGGAALPPAGAPSPGGIVEREPAPLCVLIADDTLTNRFILEHSARRCGLTPITANDGDEAVAIFEAREDLQIVLLDWMMPGRTGVEVCRHIRAHPRGRFVYVIMITARDSREDIREGLAAGADDYVVKPADLTEMELRLRVGIRTVKLQGELRSKIEQLECSTAEVRRLQGLLPMCMYCKKIRDDSGYWESVEVYIRAQSDAQVSHGICPDCMEERFPAYSLEPTSVF